MRMGSFLAGGLAGAAAVVYLYKNKEKLINMTADFMLSGMKSSVKESNLPKQADSGVPANAKISKADPQFSEAGSVSGSANPSASGHELEEVRKWVADDPHLSATVQQILEHNNEQPQNRH